MGIRTLPRKLNPPDAVRHKNIELVRETRRLNSRSMRKRKQTTPMKAMMSPGTMKDRPQLEETQ